MKPIADQTHYEVLEIESSASAREVERAYRVAKAAYGEGSLAHYSVFDGAEAASILERVELAWRVLSDPESRADYDASLRGPRASAPVVPTPAAPSAGRSASQLPLDAIDAIDEAEDPGEDASYDGASLRRIRLRRGLELDQIAEVTKVNPRYLRCIEEEHFDDLPAPVYVRGFVTAYARAVRLDAAVVAARYMERFNEVRGGGRRSRLLGRR